VDRTFDDISGLSYRDTEYDLVTEEELLMPIMREGAFNINLELSPKEISIIKCVLIEWIIKEKIKNAP